MAEVKLRAEVREAIEQAASIWNSCCGCTPDTDELQKLVELGIDLALAAVTEKATEPHGVTMESVLYVPCPTTTTQKEKSSE